MIKDLRQVIKMRDKQIETNELALAQRKEELAEQSLRAEKLQQQVKMLSTELQETQENIADQHKVWSRAQMGLSEELSQATKKYVQNQGELSLMKIENMKLSEKHNGLLQKAERDGVPNEEVERLRSDLLATQSALSDSEAARMLLETQAHSLQVSLKEMEASFQRQTQAQLDLGATTISRQPARTVQRSAAPVLFRPEEHLPALRTDFENLQKEFATLATAHEQLLQDFEAIQAGDQKRVLGFESVLTENEDLKHQLAGLLNQNEDLKDQLAVLKDIKRSKDAALDTAMMTKKADVERQEQLVQQLEALYATHEQVHKATFGRATKKAIVAR